eukprot:scaffold304379_cov27-Tisochrysis_lutea.AAC.2
MRPTSFSSSSPLPKPEGWGVAEASSDSCGGGSLHSVFEGAKSWGSYSRLGRSDDMPWRAPLWRAYIASASVRPVAIASRARLGAEKGAGKATTEVAEYLAWVAAAGGARNRSESVAARGA